MASVTHLHPNFASVFAIEAVNEPIMDAAMTPGYGDCEFTAYRVYSLLTRLVGWPILVDDNAQSSTTSLKPSEPWSSFSVFP